MKLNVLERFMLLGILPTESNFATLKIINSLKENLGFTEEEYKEFDIRQENSSFKWNIKGNEEKEINIGEKATDIIVEKLKELDKSNKITLNHISVYEKFIK